tara:strand:+ start:35 stop:1084 length:1050 start_codon:yes stop_codon:yes gene_type:complete
MKFYKLTIFILIVFLKTETLLSDNNLFNVNNIQLKKNENSTNTTLANRAIKKGFDKLIKKILLNEDTKKLSDLNLTLIKQLVTYYQISKVPNKNEEELVNFSVTFDKDKIHDLFYKQGISYSDISDKEFFILPIQINKDQINVYNNNFFYENWNETSKDKEDLIEFILLLENIEIIQNINKNRNSLINLEIDYLFKEYSEKNLALILIEESKSTNSKVYIKAKIQGKKIDKGLTFKKNDLKKIDYNLKIITETKKEIIDLVKSENLIDIRTPSFLNVKLNLKKKTSLVEFNSRIKNIDLIEKVYVQEFNKNYINLRIKYLGKLDKIINQLKNENIKLQFINEQWTIKTL